MRRALVALVVWAACGDDRTVEQHIEAVSGTRTKLQLYLYEDGTRQVDSSAFYDTARHVACSPGMWIDGVQRCIPVVGEAVFADASCETPIGFWPSKEKRPPTHFLGYERVDDARVPAHLYPVSAKIASATEYYARSSDACNGPFGPPIDVATYGLAPELAPQSMQAMFDTEIGDGRITLHMKTTPDGLQVPWTVFDRDLDSACTPTIRTSGVVCEPDALDVNSFVDPSCTQPAVVLTDGVPHPSLARMRDPSGCSQFAALGDEITTAYALSGTTCYPFSVGGGQRAFAVGASVELATLSRSVEQVDGHRMLHEIFSPADDVDLRFVGGRLFDLATRAECELSQVGDLKRCLPAKLPLAVTLFGSSCAVPVKVVLLSRQACDEIAFAVAFTDTGETAIHAVGDVITDTLYQYTNLGCVPYTSASGIEPHAIGPAIPADHFASALLYGAR